MQYTTPLLSVYLHHAAIKNADPKLEHDAPELLVGVCCSSCDKRQMVRVVILQTPWGEKGQGVEVQVWNAQQAFQKRQTTIAGADHDYPSVNRNFALTQKLLGHNG
jgi:hypothetical protein